MTPPRSVHTLLHLQQKLHLTLENCHFELGGGKYPREDIKSGKIFWVSDDDGMAFKGAVAKFVCADNTKDLWYSIEFDSGILPPEQVCEFRTCCCVT